MKNAPKQFYINPDRRGNRQIPRNVPKHVYSSPAQEAMQKKLSSGQKPSAAALALEKKLNNK